MNREVAAVQVDGLKLRLTGMRVTETRLGPSSKNMKTWLGRDEDPSRGIVLRQKEHLITRYCQQQLAQPSDRAKGQPLMCHIYLP